jgi:hypothetical protein
MATTRSSSGCHDRLAFGVDEALVELADGARRAHLGELLRGEEVVPLAQRPVEVGGADADEGQVELVEHVQRAADVGVAEHGVAQCGGGEHPGRAQQHRLGAQRPGQLQRGAPRLVLQQRRAEVAEHLDHVGDPGRRTGPSSRAISRRVVLHDVNPTRGPHSVVSPR